MRIRRTTPAVVVGPVIVLIGATYVRWLAYGLPAIPVSSIIPTGEPQGCPLWLRVTHYVNLLFIIILPIRSGLQILMDHPRLYWNVHCAPGTEWLGLTSVVVLNKLG